MRIAISAKGQEFIKATNTAEKILAKGITISMREGAKVAVQKGRDAITAVGFSQKFARTLQAVNKPPTGYVLNPSVFIHSTINYADVFESGKMIQAKTWLWLPQPQVPPFKGRPHMTPKQYIENVGKLVLMWRPGKPPMLGAPVPGAVKPAKRISLARFKKGATKPRREVTIVPMFVGVKSINIPKKFDATGAVENALQGFQIIVNKNIPDQEIS